jgi:hypothetical protein
VWEVSREGRHFKLCRSLDWLLDFSQESFYGDLADCLRRAGEDRVAVFRMKQNLAAPAWKVEETEATALRLGPRAGVSLEGLQVSAFDVYATFGKTSRAGQISVVEATYGGNCGAPAGNATPAVRASCDSMSDCSFRVEVDRLGDPAPKCAKGFSVKWTCLGNSRERLRILAPEAGFGEVAHLTCAQ